MPDLTTAISLVALLVSIVSGVIAWRTSHQQNQLQRRLIELEDAREGDRLRTARRAQLVASIHHPTGRQYALVVINGGQAAARNIRVQLDGQPLLAHRLVPRGQTEAKTLGPGAEARYILAVTMGTERVVTVEVGWEDDSGEPGRWESHLTL